MFFILFQAFKLVVPPALSMVLWLMLAELLQGVSQWSVFVDCTFVVDPKAVLVLMVLNGTAQDQMQFLVGMAFVPKRTGFVACSVCCIVQAHW
jgi:hypothetical protein